MFANRSSAFDLYDPFAFRFIVNTLSGAVFIFLSIKRNYRLQWRSLKNVETEPSKRRHLNGLRIQREVGSILKTQFFRDSRLLKLPRVRERERERSLE